jgi:hypothetical protein
MRINLETLLNTYQKMLDDCTTADTHASYLSGKVDVIKDLIALGFKEGI